MARQSFGVARQTRETAHPTPRAHVGLRTPSATPEQARCFRPWDRPLMHKLDLSSEVLVGSGGRVNWVGAPPGMMDRPRDVATCKPYGGNCLGDGCMHWFPLPSPPRCQEATCGLARNGEPISLREAKRRVRQNIHRGNEAIRLGWDGSAQVSYRRAWAYAVLVAELEEAA